MLVLRREKVNERYSCGIGGGTADFVRPDGVAAGDREGEAGVGDTGSSTPAEGGIGSDGIGSSSERRDVSSAYASQSGRRVAAWRTTG